MSKKKKILLLSDDLRMHSGIATVSKDIVMETLNEYDWVQIAGAIKHPDKGKVFDMSKGLEDYDIKNGYLKIYPVDGYGDESILREVMAIEKPDAILHYTDPRFWIWLYKWKQKFVDRFQYFIIIYGMIGQLLNIINFSMKVVM